MRCSEGPVSSSSLRIKKQKRNSGWESCNLITSFSSGGEGGRGGRGVGGGGVCPEGVF